MIIHWKPRKHLFQPQLIAFTDNTPSANFNYCPIVCLFCGKTNLKKLEKLQERALATVYCDKSLAYEDMLKKSGQLCIRLNLIRLLVIEMFKCMNGLNPLYINDMFSGKDSSYNLRDNSRLMQPKFNTKIYGYKSLKYLHVGSKFWNCLPPCVKNVNDLNLFKKNIYNWCLTGQELARTIRAIRTYEWIQKIEKYRHWYDKRQEKEVFYGRQ